MISLRRVFFGHLFTGTLVMLTSWPVEGQFRGVLTWHNDNARTGQNLAEVKLKPSNVNATNFGKKCSFPVDGAIDAQPLYIPSVTINRQTHNVVYVATEHNSVYAFDADCRFSGSLWHAKLFETNHGLFTAPSQSLEPSGFLDQFGITGTPVIDVGRGILYVVTNNKESVGNVVRYVHRLHALDIGTGMEQLGGPVVIRAAIHGSGETDEESGAVHFNPQWQIQRPGLLLLNGVVYIGWAAHKDRGAYHGWLMGYDARTLEQVYVFNDTPNGAQGGIWQSSAAPASDENGNIFVQTGNGTFDADVGGSDYGDSLLSLATGQGHPTVANYFTPYNQAFLSSQDLDLGSGGVLLLPRQRGAHPHETVSAGKEGKIFVVDRDAMGKFNPHDNSQIVQTVEGSPTGYFSSPSYWRNTLYYAAVGDNLKMYTVTDGLLSASPVSSSSTAFGYPGSTPSISANGSVDGLVWAIEVTNGPAVLHVFDATQVSQEIYNSNQAGTRDQLGIGATFSVPTVANGHVYVGTQTELDVLGLLDE
jgi:hypothetical protein